MVRVSPGRRDGRGTSKRAGGGGRARSPGPSSRGVRFHYYFNYYNFLNRLKVIHNSRFCHLYTCQMQSIKHK